MWIAVRIVPFAAFCAAALAVVMPGPRAMAAEDPKPFCWFYSYIWAVNYMTPNVTPPTTYAKTGYGNGIFITTGDLPTDETRTAAEQEIAAALPRGDQAAPPPSVHIHRIDPMICPIGAHLPKPPPQTSQLLLRASMFRGSGK